MVVELSAYLEDVLLPGHFQAKSRKMSTQEENHVKTNNPLCFQSVPPIHHPVIAIHGQAETEAIKQNTK